MIYIRGIHFAATITVAGVAIFIVFVAEPAFRKADGAARLPALIRRALAWLAWIGLLVTVASGAAWLTQIAQSMSEEPLSEVFSQGILWTVLLQTGFGRDWLARSVLALLLAAAFVPFLSTRGRKSVWIDIAAIALAAGLVGSLAFAGHAVGGAGSEGIIHPVADFLHLLAAAAWVGTLLPLALLLAAAGYEAAPLAIARTATVKFSTLGIASVATLLIAGSINTWYLAGSVAALTETDYGRLLLIKIALFLVMVAIAAVNRLRLTPRLVVAASATTARDALWQLRRNAVIEVVLGAIIIAIVAVLGMTPPGLHQVPSAPAHHHSH
jgi:copper resistance protein D